MSIKKALTLLFFLGLLGHTPGLCWGGQAEMSEAKRLSSQALQLYQTGHYQEALPLAQKSLQICEKILGPENLATAYSQNNLALIYHHMGAYDKALRLFERSLDTTERAMGPYHPATATSLKHLAGLYQDMGAYDKALPLYQRALKIAEKGLGPNDPKTAEILNDLAMLYNEMGDYDQALTLYQRSLKIKEKALGPKHPGTADSLNNLATLYFAMGAYDEAIRLFERSLEISEKALGPEHHETLITLANLGGVYLALKEFSKAAKYFKLSKSQSGLVSLALAMGHPEMALQNLSGITPPTDPDSERLFYSNKGLALAGVGRLSESALDFLKAVQVVEKIRRRVPGERAGFLQGGKYERNIIPYRGLMTVLSRMALTDTDLPIELKSYGPDPLSVAFYFAEATKARAMLETMARAAQKTTTSHLPETLREREEALKFRLAINDALWKKALLGGEGASREVNEARKKLDVELDNLIQELRQSQPLYAALHYPQPLPAVNLPLKENEVLLEYALGEEASYVFEVRKGGVKALYPIISKKPLPLGRESLLPLGREALKEKVREFMYPLLNPEEDSFSVKQGKELYDMLLKQPLATVKDGERVVIVPDDDLGLLPFEALVMREGEKPIFVGDRFTLTYYQSASVLALQRTLPEQNPPRPLFALGNPIYNKTDPRYLAWKQGKPAPLLARTQEEYAFRALATTRGWGKTARSDTEGKELDYLPLQDTEDEVKDISQICGVQPQPPDVLLDLWANETQFRKAPLEDYRYLHFATHADLPGHVQGKNEPFILLGQVENKKPDDGFLTLSKVLSLKLRAQMVVLSTCLTGRGKVMEGEGVANFARAFQYAGARSVVVSLWEVKSKVGREYMVKFYSYLKGGKGRAEALRLARQDIKKDYPDPFLWAVFILHGEG